PHLDGELRHRGGRGELDGLVEVAGFDQQEAGQIFFGFGEWPIGRGHLAVADADGHGFVGRLQRLRVDEMAALPQLLVVIDRRIGQGDALGLGEGIHLLRIDVDKTGILHRKILLLTEDRRSRGGAFDNVGRKILRGLSIPARCRRSLLDWRIRKMIEVFNAVAGAYLRRYWYEEPRPRSRTSRRVLPWLAIIVVATAFFIAQLDWVGHH